MWSVGIRQHQYGLESRTTRQPRSVYSFAGVECSSVQQRLGGPACDAVRTKRLDFVNVSRQIVTNIRPESHAWQTKFYGAVISAPPRKAETSRKLEPAIAAMAEYANKEVAPHTDVVLAQNLVNRSSLFPTVPASWIRHIHRIVLHVNISV